MFNSGYGRKSALHPGQRSTRTSGGVVRFQGTVCQPLVVLKRQGNQESVPRTLAKTSIRAPALCQLVDSHIHVPIAGAVTQPLPASKANNSISLRAFISIRYPKLQTPVHTRCP
ncbi:hypothetical protein DPMN_049841 [Dreissena polymorpha]|uniref:Uncharacterized protein n=1 Tax=Dreissena polymorpha TaxID=45954 RepID=A0A9D4CF15_DREPO|nr:hypothetical protein DPMN_049841 [Dreissena polymorpha]